MRLHDATRFGSTEQMVPSKPIRLARPWILGFLAIVIVFQIVALTPAPLEQAAEPLAPVDPSVFVPEKSPDDLPIVAESIPKGRVPDYTIDDFSYVSTQAGVKQWKMKAATADLYNDIKLVHSKQVKAEIFDPNGAKTIVTGKESRYNTEKRDLEVFGNVRTVFPDGFEIHSEYLLYQPNERRVAIPKRYGVNGGDGLESKAQTKVEFNSMGLDYLMAESRVTLPESVEVRTHSPSGEKTSIRSDRCVIHRDQSIAYFTMSPSRPSDSRYVFITQPTLLSRGRRAELHYGSGEGKQALHYLIVREDVLLRETGTHELKYATAGRAAFDSKKNDVILTEFPQVYQEEDTVAGERITLHRDTDVDEVEHSNAFSRGVIEN